MKDIIYLYLPDAMADWETGYLLQGLTMQNMLPAPRYHLKTVGASTAPVRTLGGMTVVPDCAISQVQKEKIAALLLPGGDSWSAPEQRAVLELAACLLEQGTLVAAICGATLPLLRHRGRKVLHGADGVLCPVTDGRAACGKGPFVLKKNRKRLKIPEFLLTIPGFPI